MKEREDVKTDEGEESRKRVKTKRRRIKKGIEEEEKVFVIHKLYVYNKVEKKKQTNKERKREEIV